MSTITGTAGSDTLFGGDDGDVIAGLAGDDTLYGAAGDDSLDGGSGADWIFGGDGIDGVSYSTSGSALTLALEGAVGSGGDAEGDVLFSVENIAGSAFNDRLTGSASANRIDGGAGNDTLIGGGGADQLNGGTGNDLADYSSSGSGVTIALGGAAGSGGDAQGDALLNIESLVGSGFTDRLVGSAFGNRIEGGAGNDTLIGGGGADLLHGGTGWDAASYEGSSGGVTVQLGGPAGSGGDAQGDTLYYVEAIIGSSGHDMLVGSAVANQLFGGSGNDTLFGGGGNDTLIGGVGTNTLIGGSGDHRFEVSSSFERVVELSGEGTDTVLASATYLLPDGVENLILTGSAVSGLGGSQDNHVSGNELSNLLWGGAGNDTLDGGAGRDILRGDAGADTASFASSMRGVHVDLLNGLAQIIQAGGVVEFDELIDIENALGSNQGDTLIGDLSANGLFGGGGNDTLIGLGGADLINGGNGRDLVSYANGLAGVTAFLDGIAGSGGDAAGDVIQNVEDLIGTYLQDQLVGSAAGNALFGGSGDDLLDGGNGSDTLFGGMGADTLFGGDQSDTLIGGVGADMLFGGASDDVLIYGDFDESFDGGAGFDVLDYSRFPFLDLGDIDQDLVSIEAISLTGGGANRLSMYSSDSGLYVYGDVDDSVRLVNGVWTVTGTTTQGFTYVIYTEAGGSQLFIENELTVIMGPPPV